MSCPICRQPTEPQWRPFCSRRCADIDLARWLGGTYHLQTDEAPEAAQESPPPDRDPLN